MHPAVIQAIDEIDAMIFSGDPSEDDMKVLETMMARWTRGIKSHRETQEETDK